MTGPVVLTGATGFLGSHIGDLLCERGIPWRAVVRSPAKAEGFRARGAEVRAGDLGDTAAMEAAFAGASAIIANAALSTREPKTLDDFRAANVDGVRNVLRAAIGAGVRRVVLVSSVSVHRVLPFRLHRTDDPLLTELAAQRRFSGSFSRATTLPHYAWTKAEGEALARKICFEEGISLTVIRPGPIYGPRDPKLTARYAAQMRDRRVIFAPLVQAPHVHAGDVAGAILGALANPASGGKAYFTAGEPISPYRLLTLWKRLAGRGPRIVPVPLFARVAFDDTPAMRDLGYSRRSFEDGLRSVIEDIGRRESEGLS